VSDPTDIELRGVWKTFPGHEPTLAGMDLKVAPGSIHVLMGYSGTGKSVTLKHVLGLLKPDEGDVLVKGRSVARADDVQLREIRRDFGMLFQNAALFDSYDVYENVAFPLREHRKDMGEDEIYSRVTDLLERVDLNNVLEKMPSDLSGGMRKRVGLARALALEPKILLFDEPTTGLDPVTSQLIDDLIVKSTRELKASALIISHDVLAALRIGDFVSMLWKGKIIETARPEELRKSGQEPVVHFLRSAGAV
jgi:phospholipid/cholesterol/gamma-HCH transport system ATP-binding protein